ncbi:MAG: LCP family protein [Erysipelotrichaceae bacterium]|nr:LCP family protein [Erysipelotrichaceae bacterium]
MMNKQSLNKLGLFRLICTVLSVISVAVCIALFFAIGRYAEISISLILAVLLILLMISLIVGTLCFSSFIFKKNVIFPVLTAVLSVAVIAGGCVGTYLISTVNSTIDNIIDTDEVVDEMITSYFVAYDDKNAKDAGSDYLKGKTVGVLNNDQILEGNVLARAEIERLGLEVEYVEYETYQELLFALFEGEVEIAAVAPSYASSFTTDDGQDENLEKVSLVYSYKSKATVQTSTKNDVDLTEPFTMLIIGVDSLSAGNSDVLMLASFNPNTLDITLTSIARDSFVPIACYGGANNKINAARTTRQCLIDTVENLLDVDINFYFETNFQGVVDIVDALGGIIINSPISFTGQTADIERGHKTVWVPAGEYHATGEQVLAFVRERHAFADGDFARQRHQQQVIRTLLREFLNLNDITKILNVMEAAGENISTNMSLSQIRELLTYCLQVYNSNYDQDSLIFDIQSNRITGYSSWTYNTRMEKRLWIYKLFKGSIQDNVNIIKDNLELTKKLDYPQEVYVDLISLFRAGYELPTWYNEKQEHEKMPAFVEVFVGKNINDLKAWASENGLTLNIKTIGPKDDGYDASLADGTVLWQSVSSGRVALISSLEVHVIKHPLDCSLSENKGLDECQNVYINAVDKKIDDVQKWAKEKGITLSLNVIKAKDEGYDIKKAGYVKSQTEKAYGQFNDSKSLGVTYYEKISVIFYDENEKEITDYLMKVCYDTVIKSPEYKPLTADATFKGWMNMETKQMYNFETPVTGPLKLKASCAAPSVFKVTFVYGLNGEHQQILEVVEGKAATAPDAAVEGYTFKWDKEYSNITGDVIITAKYEKKATPTPTPSSTPEVTPTPTPETTPTPTPEATPEPTPVATPEPTPEATPEPTPEATPESTPDQVQDSTVEQDGE